MFHYSMKKQIFNFYATPLNIWSIVGFMFLAMICSGIIYEVFFAPAYGIESTLRFISITGLVTGVIFLLLIIVTIRKKSIEVTDDNLFKYYSGGKLIYTNTMDNLYYIEAVDISRGIIGEMAFCFNDKKIRISMPSHLPHFYEPGKYEWIFSFFVKSLNLKKMHHHTLFGKSKYVFAYWNPVRKANYEIYSKSRGQRFL